MKRAGYFSAGTALLIASGLLFYSREVALGVRAGLQSCATLLIPSLFPFMILAALISCTAAGRFLSKAVCTVLTPLIGLPKSLGAVFFMSTIGGFPVGARMLSQQLEQKEIDAPTASRALCCCVNSGPSFLITAVGAGMLGSRTAGLVLLGCQIVSSLCIAALEFRGNPIIAHRASGLPPNNKAAFVQSVRSASAGMLGVCSFVVAFSAITALLNASGIIPYTAQFFAALFPQLGEPFFRALLSGILEVTNGCITAAALHSREGFVLCAFLVSFSSLSILFQVKSCFSPDSGVCFSALYRSRLLHGLLSALLAMLCWRWLPQAAMSVVTPGFTPPTVVFEPNMLIISLCLIAMFSILLLCPPAKKHC